ncbi:hypothetical protein ACFL0G_01235 [Candidatus Zixiibacteriota bacterium]
MLKVFVIAAIIIIIIGVAILVPKLQNKSVSNLPLEEKMSLAENYLQELQRDGEAFFDNLRELKASSKDFSGEISNFDKVLSKHSSRINSLHLPCPTTSETRNDPELSGYLSWAESFETQNKKIMEHFQQELNQILK